MADKIQGEGDYEAARRYNEQVAKTVKKGMPARVPESTLPQESLDRAENAGKARAKSGGHDAEDAKIMKNDVLGKDKLP